MASNRGTNKTRSVLQNVSCQFHKVVVSNTEKLFGNRAIRRQVRFIDSSTDKKIQRPHSREILFFDQLISGFLGKIGYDTFLHMPALSECPAASFHYHISMSLEKLSTICALLNRAPSRVALASGDCQKTGEPGFQPASRTEQMVAAIQPGALLRRRGVICQNRWRFLSRPCEFCVLCER